MISLLASLAHNGCRETFHMVRRRDNAVEKMPAAPRRYYARVSTRGGKGRRSRTGVYRLVGRGADGATTYRRVDDGERGGKGEIVVRKRDVVEEEEERQRQRWSAREKGREKERERERTERQEGARRGRRHHDGGENHVLRRPRAARQPGPAHGQTSSSTNRGHVLSPFSQPDMDVGGSHAFVFGDDSEAAEEECERQVEDGEGGRLLGHGANPFSSVEDAAPVASPKLRRVGKVVQARAVVETAVVAGAFAP